LGPTAFRERREPELRTLTDAQLIEHMRRARAAGRPDAVKPALAVLVFGYWDNVARRVALKVPFQDVEDVTAIAIEAAIASAFDGQSVGEFVNWLHRIVDRRGIADYHRRKEGKPELDRLPTEHLGDDEVWGDEPSVDFAGDTVDALEALRRAYRELRPDHRDVVDLYVFGPASAREAAEQVPEMTEANVHQIASRFQRRVGELMDGGDTSSGP
jgi:DNA-directed RNA polymerase specialized sigma24 family protein